ncbi:MAG: TonB-dependent receptor [Candidatus Sphingomonas colombiensis]|nr:TonB-dependent receptor [Sphingomonas sp.]WEK44818.1 MAG: TonB-dependent receptor [Sphingomonas sp.]
MKGFRNNRVALLVGAALPFLAVPCAPAFAQDATSAAAGNSGDQRAAPVTGNDVIVTATRRPQTLLDVPLSVAVVSGEALDNMGIRQFNDLQSGVPNLQIDQTNGNFVISMRGLGSGGGNLAFEQSVGFFVDGVYSGRSRSLQTAMMDVARVEVVRGPQGALFGKNTDAGAISVITAAPTRDFEGRVSAGYEFANNGWNGDGYLSGPLTENLSARLSVQGGHAGGYMYNRVTGKKDNANNYLGMRGQLLFEPFKGMSAKLKVEYGKNNYTGGNRAYNGLGSSAVANLIRQADAQYGGAPETPSFVHVQSSPRPEFSRTENVSVTLTTNTDLGGGVQLTTIGGYSHLKASTENDIDNSPLTLADNLHTETTTQISQEARLSGSIGPLSLFGGVQYYYSKSHIVQNVFWNASGVAIYAYPTSTTVLPFDQTSESVSPFVAGNLEILPGLTFDGSLRYSHENKQARMQQLPGGPPTFVLYDIRGKRVEGLWDYSGKASYKFSSRGQIYVSYATGSKGGGFVSNDTQLGRTGKYQFNPERARSWEAGIKLRGERGVYDLNLAAFTTNFDDLQVSTFNGISFVTGNAAKVRSRGIELEGNVRPVSILSFGGNVAYLDAKYVDYPGATCVFGSPATCVSQNLAGYRLTRAPEWKWTGYAQIDAPISDDLSFTARGSANYTGLTNYQDTQNPATMMPAYTTYDARLAIASKAQRWEVALVGRNLSNAVSWSQGFGISGVPGATSVFINPGRTVTLQVSKNF